MPRGIRFEQKDGVLNALRDTEEHRALHGLARALVANAVRGVTEGFKKELDIVGVGYRAELKGKTWSSPWAIRIRSSFPVPEGIQIAVEKQTHLSVSGADRARVGQVAANIRGLRPPDPYKQKGIRLVGRAAEEEGGQGGRRQDRGVTRSRRDARKTGERSWQRNRFASCRATLHRERVHQRVRRASSGTPERPRLCVYRSLGHIYAQVIDDQGGRTLVSASSLDKQTRAQIKGGGNMAAAKDRGQGHRRAGPRRRYPAGRVRSRRL